MAQFNVWHEPVRQKAYTKNEYQTEEKNQSKKNNNLKGILNTKANKEYNSTFNANNCKNTNFGNSRFTF